MQVVKSVRISLTMGDLVQNVNQMSKQQLIQKFRILLDRKQIQINEKIQKNNAEHLLVLQKKMLILERKDDQIVKLNNTLSSLKTELNEQKMRNNDLTDEALQNKLRANHFQKKSNQFDSILKEEKAKREKIKKQLQKLQIDHKNLSDQHSNEVRAHKKIKDEKSSWQQQTQMLLNNLKKNHQAELQSKLKNIKLQYESKQTDLTQNVQQLRTKYENQKQKHNQLKVKITSLNKAIQILNKEILNQKNKQKKTIKQITQKQVQTDHSLLQQAYLQGCLFSQQFLIEHNLFNNNIISQIIKTAVVEDKQAQTETQAQACMQCSNLKVKIQQLQSEIKILKHKTQKLQRPQCITTQSQTNPLPVIKTESNFTQTIYNPLSNIEQNQLMQGINDIKNIANILIQKQRRKYQQIQKIFLQRPSKKQDRQKINELEKNKISYGMQLLQKQKQIENLIFLNNQLHQKIAQQGALMNQFNMSELELNFNKNNNKNNNIKFNHAQISTLQQTLQQPKFKNFLRQNISLTTSVRQSRVKYKSLSSSLTKIDRNYSGTHSYLQQKRSAKSPGLKQVSHKNQKLKDVLLQRGIFVKQKEAKPEIIQQISQLRRYKKYKSTLKRINS